MIKLPQQIKGKICTGMIVKAPKKKGTFALSIRYIIKHDSKINVNIAARLYIDITSE